MYLDNDKEITRMYDLKLKPYLMIHMYDKYSSSPFLIIGEKGKDSFMKYYDNKEKAH